MPTLTLKSIPDELYHRLKDQALENRRSLNSEILVCLERATSAQTVDAQAVLSRADALRESIRVPYLTESRLRAARDKGRP
jgi:hypothetical protein